MPLILHNSLKRGLIHADLYLDPEKAVEDAPHELADAEEQAAKRQRVENIASQYLQGRLPVILTASLRGPFNDGWKNPWTVPRRIKPRATNTKGGGIGDRNATSGRAGARKAKSVEAKRRTRSAGRKELEVTVASPETSRAVSSHIEEFQECHTLDTIEVPPATAPSPQEHDTSGATEFFSVDTDRCVRRQSQLTDPFWLRRPESQRKVNMKTSTDRGTEMSPTRVRDIIVEQDRRRTLQLAVPKGPIGLRAPSPGAPATEEFNSSASASMIISSPVKPTVPNHDTPAPPSDTPNQQASTRFQRDHVALPMPESSADFVYKKFGSTKWSFSNAPRSKPRAVNFNSSPATKEAAIASKPSSQNKAVVEDLVSGAQRAAGDNPHADKKADESHVGEPVQEEQSLRSSCSRQSAMSTQAAMMLAQLEFQESTFPTSLSETSRPWSQPQEETPRPILAEPSPAITPLSVFAPQLEQAHALPSVLRGPPLSTQDLFAAASPFAFSTVKKKTEAPPRSSLRMSLMSFDGHDD